MLNPLFSQWLLTWTSLLTLGGSLLVELILLAVIYDTQMFRISSYPVGGVCTRARVCVWVYERENAVSHHTEFFQVINAGSTRVQ